MITTRTEPCVLVPVETLQRFRAWLICWEDDKRCNLTPTDTSLNEARELLREALDAPRTFAPAGE